MSDKGGDVSLLPMNEVTSLSQLDPNGSYTYADYLLWKFKERVEIIKGKIVAMSPAPTRFHQRISMKMTAKFLEVFDLVKSLNTGNSSCFGVGILLL